MSIPSDLPRKEREKLLRRQAILDAASRIFAEKGFERATLDEIAEAAEFGKGTIYNYFSSKEELFFTLLEEGRQYFQELIQRALDRAETGREKIERYIDVCFDFFRTHENHFKIFSIEVHQPVNHFYGDIQQRLQTNIEESIQFLADILRQAMQSGEIIESDSKRLARALLGLIYSQICEVITCAQENFDDSAEMVKHIFLHGVLRRNAVRPQAR